jgi:hypothetical protein
VPGEVWHVTTAASKAGSVGTRNTKSEVVCQAELNNWSAKHFCIVIVLIFITFAL